MVCTAIEQLESRSMFSAVVGAEAYGVDLAGAEGPGVVVRASRPAAHASARAAVPAVQNTSFVIGDTRVTIEAQEGRRFRVVVQTGDREPFIGQGTIKSNGRFCLKASGREMFTNTKFEFKCKGTLSAEARQATGTYFVRFGEMKFRGDFTNPYEPPAA